MDSGAYVSADYNDYAWGGDIRGRGHQGEGEDRRGSKVWSTFASSTVHTYSPSNIACNVHFEGGLKVGVQEGEGKVC